MIVFNYFISNRDRVRTNTYLSSAGVAYLQECAPQICRSFTGSFNCAVLKVGRILSANVTRFEEMLFSLEIKPKLLYVYLDGFILPIFFVISSLSLQVTSIDQFDENEGDDFKRIAQKLPRYA